jgi:hypothetical protein
MRKAVLAAIGAAPETDELAQKNCANEVLRDK